MRGRLQALTDDQVEEWGKRIQGRIIASRLFQEARSLALYHPYQNEVKTEELFGEAQKAGKKVAYPNAGRNTEALKFYWVGSLRQLTPSPWGPLSPDPKNKFDAADYDSIDLMVIPGLAFDRRGGRLGRGIGFYDRTLKLYSGTKLGVAYDIQVIDTLPRSEWDEPVQYLATEGEMFQTT